jgi:hypothetical protein
MRVLIRIALTLLFAIPVGLVLTILFALEARRGSSPAPARDGPVSSERAVLGPKQIET